MSRANGHARAGGWSDGRGAGQLRRDPTTHHPQPPDLLFRRGDPAPGLLSGPHDPLFGLLGALPPTDAWWTVPLTAVIAGVFIVLERVGAVLDSPFANNVNDVPITAICRDIERDLLEQLGEQPLHEPKPVVAGYL